MQNKIIEKNKAIELRKQGLSYREILETIPVAKSSLSLWLRSVGLSKKQKQRLTEKKISSALRGAKRKKEIRITATNEIKNKARKEIGEITKRELWLVGVALYWGEGSKEKNHRPGSGLQFSNSDPRMIKLYLGWLYKIMTVTKERIIFDIYIHENYKDNIDRVINYWSDCTGFSKDYFKHVYFKKNKIKTNRKNVGSDYYGLLRINVKNSSSLNRMVAGWIEGINKNY